VAVESGESPGEGEVSGTSGVWEVDADGLGTGSCCVGAVVC